MKIWEKYLKDNTHLAEGTTRDYKAVDLGYAEYACQLAERMDEEEHNALIDAVQIIKQMRDVVEKIDFEYKESDIRTLADDFLYKNSYITEDYK